MSNLLYSINEIFGNGNDGYLQSQAKKYFNIPVYQRGYKWKNAQVSKLLDDINNFQPESSKFYCLQNITIVSGKELDYFNVVDGQQRLTTLVVILSFLGYNELVKGKIRFPENSIREETNAFINEIITEDASVITNTDWKTFRDQNSNFDHQDIFYLFNAYRSVSRWFSSNNTDKNAFALKLLNNVKLIVNNIAEEKKEEKIFSNLNSKKIPLDGADLVRAMLITRVAYEEGKREADIKNIVRVNERRVRIGWELDEINNWWSNGNVSSYFKQFISIKSEEISEGVKLFKDERYPINLLLLLFAEKKGNPKLSLEFIEINNNNALGLYKEVIKLNSTLKDWFNDREIYHYLGYLFAHSKIKFADLWEFWDTKCEKRNTFMAYLKSQIRTLVFSADESISIQSETIDWYNDEQSSLIKILILLDVIWSVKINQPFLPTFAFDRYGHDIEHIFPQRPKEVKDKKTYIIFLNTYGLKTPNKQLERDFDQNVENEEFQLRVDDFISQYIKDININSIGNLVLLDASKNRSIGNNPYSVKRAALVDDINKGAYMRPHTLKVFVRYFDSGKGEIKELLHWTNDDINGNEKAIEKILNDFFKD